MPTPECLTAYEAFRQQVRTNPALTDSWGHSDGDPSGPPASGGGVLTILERPGVGASNVAFHVIRGLRDRGVPQVTLGFGDPGSIRTLCPYHTFDDAITVPDPGESWEALRGLLEAVIDVHAPRVVVTHREFPWAWILSEIQSRRPRLRTIVVCPGGPFLFRVGGTPLESEMGRVMSDADLVVASSRFVRARLIQNCRVAPEKVKAIRGGYDPEIFHPGGRLRPGGPLRVAYVGRLEADKGPDRFMEVIHLLARAGVAFRGTVVGDGAMRAALEESAGSLLSDGTVVFTGSIDSRGVAEILRDSDVLLVPSRSEGLGIQTIEAFACSTAVVASRVGGLQELLSESGAGRLAGSTGELATHLAEMAENDHLLQGLADRGPEFLRREKMDWNSVAARWKRELDRIAPA